MQIAKNEVFSKVNALSSDMSFSLDFVKMNGEERHYNVCRMHVKPQYEKKTDIKGISTEKANVSYGLLKFYCEDVEGYRTCKIDNIKKIGVNGEEFEVA